MPQDLIFEKGAGARLGDRRRLGRPRRGRSLQVDQAICRHITSVHVKDIARGRELDEDGWADVGHGTVDWKGLIAALQAAAACISSSSTTIRATSSASPRARSPPPRNSEGNDHEQDTAASASSAAATSRPPISASRRCSAASRSRLRRHRHGSWPRRRAKEFGVGAQT